MPPQPPGCLLRCRQDMLRHAISVVILCAMATISEALAIAVQHFQAGRLQAAEQVCRQILAVEPDQPQAWHLLGVACVQLGKHQAGLECLHRALALKPDWAEAHNNLGNALKDLRKIDESMACYRRAMELKPDDVQARYNLGNAFKNQGK